MTDIERHVETVTERTLRGFRRCRGFTERVLGKAHGPAGCVPVGQASENGDGAEMGIAGAARAPAAQNHHQRYHRPVSDSLLNSRLRFGRFYSRRRRGLAMSCHYISSITGMINGRREVVFT